MTKYDATKTGTLNHEEVKAMVSELLTVWTPLVGGVTDEEVDLIMRIGGETAKPEITVEELPLALSGMVALKETNQGLTELFAKYDTASDDGSVFFARFSPGNVQISDPVVLGRYDTDTSGHLPVDQLSGLLTEINDNIPVREQDVEFIVKQVTVDKTTGITLVELKAAIASWYMHSEAAYLDDVVSAEEALKAQGVVPEEPANPYTN